MTWQDRITVDPAILVGKPVITGTRLAVELIVDLLAQGWPEGEIIRNYRITTEDIRACIGCFGNESSISRNTQSGSLFREVRRRHSQNNEQRKETAHADDSTV